MAKKKKCSSQHKEEVLKAKESSKMLQSSECPCWRGQNATHYKKNPFTYVVCATYSTFQMN